MPIVDDPLARLMIDEAAVNRELLASVLEDKIRLDIDQGAFSFRQGIRQRLTSRQQVIVALLSQKALHLLAEKYPEAMRPQEIEAVTGIKGNTLRPVLRLLAERRLVRQDAYKAYYVPGYAIEDAAIFLAEKGVEA